MEGPVSDGGTQRDRQRQETRLRIYEAALDVFRREGATAAKIDDIAQLAGVSRGTFYFHFPSKDDVLSELMLRSQLDAAAELEDIDLDTPLEQVLTSLAEVVAGQWAEEPKLLAEIGMVALKTTAEAVSDTARLHPLQLALVPFFAASQRRSEVSGMIPPELLSQFFLVNLFGAALAWTGNPMLPLSKLLGNVVTFFLRAARV